MTILINGQLVNLTVAPHPDDLGQYVRSEWTEALTGITVPVAITDSTTTHVVELPPASEFVSVPANPHAWDPGHNPHIPLGGVPEPNLMWILGVALVLLVVFSRMRTV